VPRGGVVTKWLSVSNGIQILQYYVFSKIVISLVTVLPFVYQLDNESLQFGKIHGTELWRSRSLAKFSYEMRT